MTAKSAEQLVAGRRSVRAFLPGTIPRPVVEDLLRTARSAPSGANLQPGRFHVLTGVALRELTDCLMETVTAKRPQVSQYSYFPDPMPAYLKSRQRETGFALYSALGIAKRDVAGRKRQFRHNYRFFDAPVGIIVSIDKEMGKGCFMDLGMAIQSFFIAAEAKGLATCGIGAIAGYADVVHEHLKLPQEEIVVCGLALGYPDWNHPVNTLRTKRANLEDFSTFSGFED